MDRINKVRISSLVNQSNRKVRSTSVHETKIKILEESQFRINDIEEKRILSIRNQFMEIERNVKDQKKLIDSCFSEKERDVTECIGNAVDVLNKEIQMIANKEEELGNMISSKSSQIKDELLYDLHIIGEKSGEDELLLSDSIEIISQEISGFEKESSMITEEIINQINEEIQRINDSIMEEKRFLNKSKLDVSSLFKSLEEKFNFDIKQEEKARFNDKERIYSLLDQTLLILEEALDKERN